MSEYSAKRAAMVFGQAMRACPKCGGYELKYQAPIKLREPVGPTDSASEIIGKWARTMAMESGCMVEGPVYIQCFGCLHKGPAMDCSGMSSEQVGQSKDVADTVKRLWNEQCGEEEQSHAE